jgi:hypothetical protein
MYFYSWNIAFSKGKKHAPRQSMLFALRYEMLAVVVLRFVVLRLSRILKADDFHHLGAHFGVQRFFRRLRVGFFPFGHVKSLLRWYAVPLSMWRKLRFSFRKIFPGRRPIQPRSGYFASTGLFPQASGYSLRHLPIPAGTAALYDTGLNRMLRQQHLRS